MALQWPLVVARLLTVLPNLSGWDVVTVFEGAAYDNSKSVFCTVAHSDDGMTTTAGQFVTAQSADGFQYAETGHVACQLTYTDDKAPPDVLRDKVFGLFNAVDAAIRADRRLGVLSPEGSAALDVSVTSMQVIQGAGLTVPFSITYFTVT